MQACLPEKIHISDSDRKKSIGILLSEIGYDCAYGGKWHIPELEIPEGPKGYGFKRICGFKDDSLAQSCIKFIRKKRDTPFFLVASFDNPHNICEWRRTQALPWGDVPEPRSLDECPNLPANFEIPPFEPEVIRLHQKINPRVYAQLSYSQEDWRKYRYAYFRLVEKVDAEIGKIISALKKLKLDEDTLVIFSSDHGDSNGVHRLNQKTVLYEGPVHVPLIISMKGATRRMCIDNRLVSNGLDIFPTICDYAGVETPKGLVGRSLRPLIEKGNKNVNWRTYIGAETQLGACEPGFGEPTEGRMIRTERYKYISYNWGKYSEQLFDLKNDPGEMINLAIESSYKDILNKHRQLLIDWCKKTGDTYNKMGTHPELPFNIPGYEYKRV